MPKARILLGGVIGVVMELFLTYSLPPMPPIFATYLPLLIGGFVGGYIAIRNGWIAGLMVGIVDAGSTLIVFMMIGNILGKGVSLSLPTALFLKIMALIPCSVVSGYTGERIRDMIAHRRSNIL